MLKALQVPHPTVVALAAQASTHRLNSAGTELVWREWGSGPALVLLHGGHGCWAHWVRNIAALAQRHRVLVPDMPGFGDSSDWDLPSHDAQRPALLVQALAQGIETLVPAGGFHLAGFSFGGAVAGMLAPRLPRLSRLVLIGSAGSGSARRETGPQRDWRVSEPAVREAALRHNLASFMLSGEHAVDDLAFAVHQQACEATRFRSKTLACSASLASNLSEFVRPVFMLWGDADVTATPWVAAEALSAAHPEREWAIVPRAGHWVQYERAHEVNQLMLSWLAASD